MAVRLVVIRVAARGAAQLTRAVTRGIAHRIAPGGPARAVRGRGTLTGREKVAQILMRRAASAANIADRTEEEIFREQVREMEQITGGELTDPTPEAAEQRIRDDILPRTHHEMERELARTVPLLRDAQDRPDQYSRIIEHAIEIAARRVRNRFGAPRNA